MPRARKPVLIALVAALGLGAGAGGAALISRDGGTEPVPSATRLDLPVRAQTRLDAIAPEPVPAPAVEPATAREALTAFFAAQVDERAADAYALITADGRRRFPSFGSWETGAVDRLIPQTFALGPEQNANIAEGEAVDITVDATHRPALDTFSGLVPGRARETWRVRLEAGRWRVEPDPVDAVPVLPGDTEAEDVVRAWVARVRACDTTRARSLQLSPLLYGPIRLGNAPCTEHGSWKVGAPTSFAAAPDDGTYIAAFGPGIASWGRLVPVTGPRSSFLAAVGPLGDDWRVLGVLGGTGNR
jgi:hypothetical protein